MTKTAGGLPVWMGIGLALLLTLGFAMALDPAFAASGTAGGTAAGEGFRCSGGRAIGVLYDSGVPCPTTMKMSNLFSFLVCNMERLASNLMGNMYCGILSDLTPAVMAMLTLATLFFGVGFTIGVIPATAKDFQSFLLKVVFVFAFATQADYLIGYGYRFLITGLREGVAIGLSAMFEPLGGSTNVTGLEMYGYLDKFLAKSMHLATDYIGATGTGEDGFCKNAVFAVLAIMAVAFPPIFYIGVMIIFRVALTFLRAIFGYLYSIIGIVFLLTLAPFFLSFFLFRQTRPFFDKWLGYLVSFALQMVILFAFLAFILSIDVKHISGGLTSIIVPVKESVNSTTMLAPWKYCTVCKFDIIDKNGEVVTNRYEPGTIIEGGTLRCKTPKEPITIFTGVAPTEADKPDAKVQSALIQFAATGLLSLLVLAYLIEYLLTYVPALGAFLAGGMGAPYAPQLGGGSTGGNQRVSMDMPGGEVLNTMEDGFSRGFTKDMDKTSAYSLYQGTKEAMGDMVLGGRGGANAANDPGLITSFTNFLLNPHRDPYGH